MVADAEFGSEMSAMTSCGETPAGAGAFSGSTTRQPASPTHRVTSSRINGSGSIATIRIFRPANRPPPER
jgi:hypothetical protein